MCHVFFCYDKGERGIGRASGFFAGSPPTIRLVEVELALHRRHWGALLVRIDQGLRFLLRVVLTYDRGHHDLDEGLTIEGANSQRARVPVPLDEREGERGADQAAVREHHVMCSVEVSTAAGFARDL